MPKFRKEAKEMGKVAVIIFIFLSVVFGIINMFDPLGGNNGTLGESVIMILAASFFASIILAPVAIATFNLILFDR